MRKLPSVLFALAAVLTQSCKGPEGPTGSDAPSDKQLRFTVSGGANTTSSSGVIVGDLIKFNKTYFVGVDSVLFVAQTWTGNSNSPALVELYNITDSVAIANSLLTSNQTNPSWQQSGNLYSSIPAKEIHLGIRVRSSINGTFAGCGQNFLFLYRK